MSKAEIEKILSDKGDFVKIDYIKRLLKENPNIELKKFCYLKLAEVYEKRNMFNDASKMYENIGILSVTFTDKIKNHVKEAELYIRAGFFDKADDATKKAMNFCNVAQKEEVLKLIRDFYKRQAESYENEMRRNHAVKLYERLIQMNLPEPEKDEIKNKLRVLYEKLGKFREADMLKRSV